MRRPRATRRPRSWIRGLLVLTCTGVSFAHGSNDGQKGMGLIMLILIGTLPTAYALNRRCRLPAQVQNLGNRRQGGRRSGAGHSVIGIPPGA